MTLMRTHSAPPDEHAGVVEIGGDGIRTPFRKQFQVIIFY